MRLTSGENAIDPLTGLPIILGSIRVTQDGAIRVTQTTGAPSGSLNTRPGTDTVAAPNSAVRRPYGFTDIPKTGPL